MAIFQLSAQVTVTCTTEVEADTETQALEIAAGRSVEVGGWASPNDAWIIEDGDGEPKDVSVESESA